VYFGGSEHLRVLNLPKGKIPNRMVKAGMCFALLLVVGIAVLLSPTKLHAQDARCDLYEGHNAYYNYQLKKRLATGDSDVSLDAAKERALKRVQEIVQSPGVRYTDSACEGEPQIVCTESSSHPEAAFGPYYRIHIGFICANDEGFRVPEKAKQISVFFKQDDKYLTDRFQTELEESLQDQSGNSFEIIKKECGVSDWPANYTGRFWVDTYFEGIVLGDSEPRNFSNYKINGTCPPKHPPTSRDPEPKSAEDSPNPRIDWKHQTDFSNKSYATAQARAEANVAKRNLCRMRGGAVDFTYSQKYTAQYWVTIKYRCQYD
jgi:hypothetical protein